MTSTRLGPTKGARAGLVLAHGRGSKSDDILGLVAAAGLTDVAAIAPAAPGRSWWPMPFLAPTEDIAPYVAAGVAAMSQAIAELESQGLARDRIWLSGFSQGACLALETFARQGAGLAGVLGFSGGLVGTADAGHQPSDALYGHRPKLFDYPERLDGTRVWLSTHEVDPHIPVARVKDSAAALQSLGATVRTMIYPGSEHRVMPADLAALQAWLSD